MEKGSNDGYDHGGSVMMMMMVVVVVVVDCT